MNEKQFNAKLLTNFQKIHLISFEACALASVPDLFGQVTRGVSFWMEGKIKIAADSPIPFRLGQERWAIDLIKHGGIYFVTCLLPRPGQIQIYSTSVINDRLVPLHSGFVAVNGRSWAGSLILLEDRILSLLKRKFSASSPQAMKLATILGQS